MDTDKDHPFGSAPADQLPPEKQLEEARKRIAGLENQLADVTQVLSLVLDAAGNAREDKLLGCDRCSECTLRVSQVLQQSLHQLFLGYPAKLVANLRMFVSFPRALSSLLLTCAGFVENAKARSPQPTARTLEQGVFIAELRGLCDEAQAVFRTLRLRPERALYFARVAAVLEHTVGRLEETLSTHPGWSALRDRIDQIAASADSIIDILDDRWFKEKRWENRRQQSSKTGSKRVCGGGIVREPLRAQAPDPRPVYVIDFSRNHFLGVLDAPVTGKVENWEFFPCQRELPFRVGFQPWRRDDQLDEHFPTRDTLRKGSCGRFYQLFKIDSVFPEYYYHALCAISHSSHSDAVDGRIVDTYDWPEVPAVMG